MVATLGRSKIDQLLPSLPSGTRAHLAAGLGSGEAPHGVPLEIVHAGQQAFVYALQYGLRLGSAVALLGALLAWTLVRARVGTARELPDTDSALSAERSADDGEVQDSRERVPA
jgi:hypothetical protein